MEWNPLNFELYTWLMAFMVTGHVEQNTYPSLMWPERESATFRVMSHWTRNGDGNIKTRFPPLQPHRREAQQRPPLGRARLNLPAGQKQTRRLSLRQISIA